MDGNRNQKRLCLAVALVLAATSAEAATASKLLFSGCGGLCLLDPDNVDAGPTPFLSPDHIDQFARGFAGWCFQHAWSPDGDRIVFVTATGLPPNSDIWSIRSDGTDLRQLVRQRRKCEVSGSWRTEDERYDLCLPSFYYGISWSPGGSEIVFLDYMTISFMQPEDEIQEEPSDYVDVFMFAGRSGRLQEYARSVDWAPNGRIYFCDAGHSGRPEDWEIWSVSRDGTDSRFVRQGCYPEVSPDGTMISFLSVDGDGLESTGVFVMDIDSSNPRYVSEGVRSSWSPDSKRLAVLEATGRRSGLIKLINADGTNPVVVHEFAGDVVSDVDWSPWLGTPTRVSPVSWGHLKQQLDPLEFPRSIPR